MQQRFVAALALACLAICAPAPAHADLASVMQRWLGTNPGGWRFPWCSRAINTALALTGHRGSGSDMAASFLRFPRTSAHRNAVAVISWGHRRVDHVAVVEGLSVHGVAIIGGNGRGHVVHASTIGLGNVLAFVEPGEIAGTAARIPWPIRAGRHKRHIRRHHRHHH